MVNSSLSLTSEVSHTAILQMLALWTFPRFIIQCWGQSLIMSLSSMHKHGIVHSWHISLFQRIPLRQPSKIYVPQRHLIWTSLFAGSATSLQGNDSIPELSTHLDGILHNQTPSALTILPQKKNSTWDSLVPDVQNKLKELQLIENKTSNKSYELQDELLQNVSIAVNHSSVSMATTMTYVHVRGHRVNSDHLGTSSPIRISGTGLKPPGAMHKENIQKAAVSECWPECIDDDDLLAEKRVADNPSGGRTKRRKSNYRKNNFFNFKTAQDERDVSKGKNVLAGLEFPSTWWFGKALVSWKNIWTFLLLGCVE